LTVPEVTRTKEFDLLKNKFILDATAGFRSMWFNKEHPNCLYVDQRPECEPDLVADHKDLSQVPDNTFKLIVYDPPHIIKSNGVNNQNTLRLFGYLKAETWQSDLKESFEELWRVLAPYGVLLFKWNNCSAQSNDVIKLFPVKPLVYNVISHQQKKLNDKSHSRKIRTLWFTFMKIPEVKI